VGGGGGGYCGGGGGGGGGGDRSGIEVVHSPLLTVEADTE